MRSARPWACPRDRLRAPHLVDPIHPDPRFPTRVLPAEPTSGVLTRGAALPAGQRTVDPGRAQHRARRLGQRLLRSRWLRAAARRDRGGALDWPSRDPWVLDSDTPSMTQTFAPVPAAVPGVVTTAFAAALGLGESDRLRPRPRQLEPHDSGADRADRAGDTRIHRRGCGPPAPGSGDARTGGGRPNRRRSRRALGVGRGRALRDRNRRARRVDHQRRRRRQAVGRPHGAVVDRRGRRRSARRHRIGGRCARTCASARSRRVRARRPGRARDAPGTVAHRREHLARGGGPRRRRRARHPARTHRRARAHPRRCAWGAGHSRDGGRVRHPPARDRRAGDRRGSARRVARGRSADPPAGLVGRLPEAG